MRKRQAILAVMMAGAAGVVCAQTTNSATTQAGTKPATMAATQAAAPAPKWIRISSTDNQMGAEAVLTVETINVAEGTTIVQLDTGDNLRMTYQDPRSMEFLDYTAVSRELRRGDLAPYMAQGLVATAKSLPTALGVQATMARWKKILDEAWKEIAPVEDKGLLRYDMAAKNAAFPKAGRRARGGHVPDTAWVDPKTGWVVKTVSNMSDGTREWADTVTYEYDIAGPADVYEAAVPRDARIVDNRPNKETKEVLDRLEGRIAKGFGNYVGVQTETLVKTDGESDPMRSVVRLIARKENVGLAETFAVLPLALPNHPGVVLPENFDGADASVLVPLRRQSMPQSFVAFVGETVSAGRFLRGRMDTRGAADIDLETAKSLVSVAQYVWPTLSGIQRYTPATQIRLIKDEEGRPGLLGIEVNYLGASNEFYKSQVVYWIDPAKDDVMMESSETVFKGGSELNRQAQQDMRTTEVAKLADGRWYPARWTISNRRPSGEGFLDPYMVREGRLALLPGGAFEANWIPGYVAATASAPATIPTTNPAGTSPAK